MHEWSIFRKTRIYAPAILEILEILDIFICFRKFPVLLNVRSSYSSAFLLLNSGFPLEN